VAGRSEEAAVVVVVVALPTVAKMVARAV